MPAGKNLRVFPAKGVPNKRYTPEFKRMVVETMKKEHLSIYAAMQEFGINDHTSEGYYDSNEATLA